MIGNGSVERYELLGELATGGMATVYFARQRGAFGFARTVAIKSMHPQLAKDPAFRAMFVDEANLTAKIRHPNVVPTLDIVSSPTKLLLVMEYVEGVSLSVLLRAARARKRKLPVEVIAAIVSDMLEGLHAAHELNDEKGMPLNVVHRDVSPQNVLVGVDGMTRVVDFGVAKATGRSYQTQTGEIRGKVGYMAPEQMFGEAIDRRVDIYASGVVLWESLVSERLFNAPTDAALVLLVMQGMACLPSTARGERLPEGLDQLVGRALSHKPEERFASAAEMLRALHACVKPATREEVGRVVRELAPEELALRTTYLRQSSPGLEVTTLDSESRAVLDVLTRATMTRDTQVTPGPPAFGASASGSRIVLPVLAGAAAVAIVIAVFALAFVRRSHADSPKTVASAAALPPSASVVLPRPAESGETSPGTSVAASPPEAPPASGSPSGKTKHRKIGPRAPTSAGSPTAPSPKTGPDCAVPYVTDEEGHRHYKAECLK